MSKHRGNLERIAASANGSSRPGLETRRRRQRLGGALAAAIVLLVSASAGAEEGTDDEARTTSAAPPGDGTWPDPPPEDPPPARKPPPAVVVYQPPPPEPAPVAPPRPQSPEAEPEHHLEISIGGAMFPAAVGDVRFSGAGKPIGLGRVTSFSKSGRELGLRNPTFWGGELTLGYRHTYFGVLVTGAIAANGRGADAAPTDHEAANQVSPTGARAYGGGLELFGSLPIGPATLSAGALVGLRTVSVPLVGFEPDVCRSSRKTGRRPYPCAKDAFTPATPFIQPRVHFDVALDTKRTLFVGGYAGLDALGDRSLVAGITVGFRVPLGG